MAYANSNGIFRKHGIIVARRIFPAVENTLCGRRSALDIFANSKLFSKNVDRNSFCICSIWTGMGEFSRNFFCSNGRSLHQLLTLHQRIQSVLHAVLIDEPNDLVLNGLNRFLVDLVRIVEAAAVGIDKLTVIALKDRGHCARVICSYGDIV